MIKKTTEDRGNQCASVYDRDSSIWPLNECIHESAMTAVKQQLTRTRQISTHGIRVIASFAPDWRVIEIGRQIELQPAEQLR
jgi:hypothetical protein